MRAIRAQTSRNNLAVKWRLNELYNVLATTYTEGALLTCNLVVELQSGKLCFVCQTTKVIADAYSSSFLLTRQHSHQSSPSQCAPVLNHRELVSAQLFRRYISPRGESPLHHGCLPLICLCSADHAALSLRPLPHYFKSSMWHMELLQHLVA